LAEMVIVHIIDIEVVRVGNLDGVET
jgi:hypothetical protein